MKSGKKKFKLPWLFHENPSISINSPFFFFDGSIYADFFFVVIFFLIFFYEKMNRRSAEASTSKRHVENESDGSGFDPNKRQRKVYEEATEAIESAYIFLFLLKKK
jgi:hypothetical protein